ncbi:MAG TPA: LamB/YcsF family protein [Devosia sp.]|nr:LamB/YcsF family protein [Devosia sp.]
MTSIDLNADLGEGAAFDAELLEIVSSASIACGGHAGSAEIMGRTLLGAKRAGVRTGAHPGFVDPENFGRKRLDLPADAIAVQVVEQLEAMAAIAEKAGQPISYVKLHGALYNWASEDYALAHTIFEAVKAFKPSMAILALDGSKQLKAAEGLGLKTIPEAFADRAYDASGLLVPRSLPGSVFSDPAQAVAQALGIASDRQITAIDGGVLKSKAKSICLHGDNEAALKIARAIRDALGEAGVAISAAPV